MHGIEETPRQGGRIRKFGEPEQQPRHRAGLNFLADALAEQIVKARDAGNQSDAVRLQRFADVVRRHRRRKDARCADIQRNNNRAEQRIHMMQWQKDQRPLFRRINLGIARHAVRVRHEVAERQHRPFRAAGRAGGVDNQGGVGVGAFQWREIALGVRHDRVNVFEHNHLQRVGKRGRRRAQILLSFPRTKDDFRLAIFKNVGRFFQRGHEINRDCGAVIAPCRVKRINPFRPVFRVNGRFLA